MTILRSKLRSRLRSNISFPSSLSFTSSSFLLVLFVLLVSFLLPLVLPSIAFALPRDRNELERYVYNHPADGKALYRLAQLLVREKNYVRAIPHLNNLVKLYPKREKLQYNLALALYKNEQLHEARLALNKVLQQRPHSKKANKLLVIIKKQLATKTKSLCQMAMAAYDKNEPYRARRFCHQIFAIDPLSEVGLLVNAMLEDDDHNTEMAKVGYEAVLEQNSQNGRACARLAAILLLTGKTERAKKLLVVAQKEAPQLPSTNIALAKLLATQNRYLEAVEATDRAIAAGSRDTTLLVFRFNCMLSLKDFHGAKGTLAKIEEKFKDLTSIPFLQGRLHFAMGEFELSIKEMERYLALDIPVTTLTVAALRIISSIHERFGQYKKSVEYINRALKLTPHNSELIAQKTIVREKWRLATMGKKTSKSAFSYSHMGDLPQAVLQRIHSFFQRAYRQICPLYEAKPTEIKVKILEAASLKLPAFYDAVTDEIVISREYFERELAPKSKGVEEHIIFHEFAHYVLRHKVGKKVFTMKNMWIIEGLAEYHAKAHLKDRQKLKELFRGPMLTFAQLNNYVVVAALDMGNTRLQAYMQSCLLVDTVLEKYPRDGVQRLIQLMVDQANHKALEKALGRNLALSGSALMAKMKKRLRYLSSS